MNEEEKKAIKKFKYCSGNFVLDKESSKTILNLIEKLQERLKLMDDYNYWIQLVIDRELELEKLQKENEELKDTNCLVKRYFKLKDTNTYLQKENDELKKSKITYKKVRDIQEKNKNTVDNKYISKQKVKDKIEKEIKYHEKNILDIENITMLRSKTAKEEAEIEFNKYAIVVLKKMLQELLEGKK